MQRKTKILVPVDFSTCSETALVYAIQLADKINANILVLNIPNFDTSNMGTPISARFVIEEQISKSRKQLKQFVQKVIEKVSATLAPLPSTQLNIKMGAIEAAICDEASESKANYIIMGTQGEHSTLDKYLGSIAAKVLRNAPCPVMVIPENAKFTKNAVIGYATDFSDADPFEIWKATKLFKPFQSQIKCVHFNEKQISVENKVAELKSYFTDTSPELDVEIHSFVTKDKVKDMNRFADEHGITIMVMYKPKRTFFDSLLHSSYTQKMAKHTTIPLLVFKEKK